MASFTITGNSTIAQSLLHSENGFISQNGTLVVSSGDAIVGTGFNQLTVLGTLSTQESGGGNASAYYFDGTTANVFIGDQGYVSTSRSTAIYARFKGSFEVRNAGTIHAIDDSLHLFTTDGFGVIEISNSGVIQSGHMAVSTNSQNGFTRITNSGLIQGEYVGISGQISSANSKFEVVNSGVIQSQGTGIDLFYQEGSASIVNSGLIQGMLIGINAGTSGDFTLINSGELTGISYGFVGNASDHTIYNTGLISSAAGGAVHFGGGTNLYDGRGGEVIGKIQGGTGIDTLYGGAGEEEMYGGAGNDFLRGGGGIDMLYGDEGNDVMRGGDGNDEMYGGDGRDTMRGGVGADFLDGGAGAHDWLDYRGSTGAVTINLGTGQASGGDASGDEFVNFERIVGTSGDDRLTGDSGDNALRGDNGNDLLRGASGDDFITGGRGADTMLGSSGVDSLDYRSSSGGVTVNLTSQTASGGDAQGDIISGFENVYGSNADDVLTGSSAANLLFGGGGSDVFRFTSSLGGSNVDKITDFSSGTDTIELDDAIFSAIAPGTLQADFFKANASGVATDANDRIIYDTNGGQLYYDADGNGAGAAIQFAQLTGAPALAFSDFEIV